jgi:hypothetical protein
MSIHQSTALVPVAVALPSTLAIDLEKASALAGLLTLGLVAVMTTAIAFMIGFMVGRPGSEDVPRRCWCALACTDLV